MQVINVQHKQCLLDIAMQYQGSINNVFGIAISNEISVTQLLVAGSNLVVPEVETNGEQKGIIYFLNKKQHIPASMDDNTALHTGGVGYMQIASTFKVS
jgi:hypothetical protein